MLGTEISLQINEQKSYITINETHWLTISRMWQNGDSILLTMTMKIYTNQINDNSGNDSGTTTRAVMYGPLVLVGLTEQNLTFSVRESEIEGCFVQVSSLVFKTNPNCIGGVSDVYFKPLFLVVSEIYGVYFKFKMNEPEVNKNKRIK